jgi:hypothetical protein
MPFLYLFSQNLTSSWRTVHITSLIYTIQLSLSVGLLGKVGQNREENTINEGQEMIQTPHKPNPSARNFQGALIGSL